MVEPPASGRRLDVLTRPRTAQASTSSLMLCFRPSSATHSSARLRVRFQDLRVMSLERLETSIYSIMGLYREGYIGIMETTI